jgi:hypothetical protein
VITPLLVWNSSTPGATVASTYPGARIGVVTSVPVMRA